MKKLVLLVLFIAVLLSCTSKKEHLTDFIEIDRIDSVIVYNHLGKVPLNSSQKDKFINDLKSLKYICDHCYKLGAVSVSFKIDTNSYYMVTNSKSNDFELSGRDVNGFPTFHATGVNLGNYNN